ncbi:unnamed protein product [Fusarium langsethiae]|nr:unnamed protein product [Fusarium langsethiae]
MALIGLNVRVDARLRSHGARSPATTLNLLHRLLASSKPAPYALTTSKRTFTSQTCNLLRGFCSPTRPYSLSIPALGHTASMSYQAQDLTKLQQYSACDISDALLKLKVPGAGFVADLNLYSPPEGDGVSVTVAPVSTVLFAPKGQGIAETQRNIPEGAHWADLMEPGTIVVLKQPDGQKNAVCGGIMAIRMKSTSLPIWARGLSTIGVGGGSAPWAIQVPLDIDGSLVCPGDLAFSDPINGVVVIPKDKVSSVIELLPKLTAADDKVKEDVLGGSTVYESFKLHRSNI